MPTKTSANAQKECKIDNKIMKKVTGRIVSNLSDTYLLTEEGEKFSFFPTAQRKIEQSWSNEEFTQTEIEWEEIENRLSTFITKKRVNALVEVGGINCIWNPTRAGNVQKFSFIDD
ncbi:hypothetical protein CAL7716_100280 (plasmid) [Calothrix sp. PCC 7716]|nr:hypothetical protein CAL7716_100280 [Calothrix sp. PCC 7716]